MLTKDQARDIHPLMYDPARIATVGVEQCQYWADLAVITDRLGCYDPRQEEKRTIARQWGMAGIAQRRGSARNSKSSTRVGE